MNKLTVKIKELLDKGWNLDKICESLDMGIELMEESDSMIADYERSVARDSFLLNENSD